MRQRFFEIAFTPAVQALQEQEGSRAAYARAAADVDTDEPGLSGREAGFISARDSFYLASVSETGWPYIQHRGGPAGFVRVLDANTIGWAEFSGNRQYVTAGNVSADDRVALFFMDYVERRRLKLFGHLAFHDPADRPDLAEALGVGTYRARVERLALLSLEGFDWNCPQHITSRFPAVGLS